MKKLLAISLLIAAPHVVADPISYQMDCPNGGTRSGTGEYTPRTGAFSIETAVNNCVSQSGTVSNGTVSANGTFKMIDTTSATLEATVESDTNRENNNQTTTRQCSKTLSGTYSTENSYLDGSATNNCKLSGKIFTPVLELVSGLEEEESLDKENHLTGTWKNCQSNSETALKIQQNGVATYTKGIESAPPVIYNCEGLVGAKRYLGICTSASLDESNKETYSLTILLENNTDAEPSVVGKVTLLSGDVQTTHDIKCSTKLAQTE